MVTFFFRAMDDTPMKSSELQEVAVTGGEILGDIDDQVKVLGDVDKQVKVSEVVDGQVQHLGQEGNEVHLSGDLDEQRRVWDAIDENKQTWGTVYEQRKCVPLPLCTHCHIYAFFFIAHVIFELADWSPLRRRGRSSRRGGIRTKGWT
jgi:hypothetical protein